MFDTLIPESRDSRCGSVWLGMFQSVKMDHIIATCCLLVGELKGYHKILQMTDMEGGTS